MLKTSIDCNPVSVSPDTSLFEVLKRMSHGEPPQKRWLSYILVVESGKLVGLVTERDIVKITAQNQLLDCASVSDVMTKDLITATEAELHNPIQVLSLFQKHRIRHLPILDHANAIIGVVTPSSIRSTLQSTDLFRLRRVNEVMATQVVTASPTYSVQDLARLMVSKRVSCVVMISPNSQVPIGILTERDIVHFQSLKLDLDNTLAQTVMSQPLHCLHPEENLWHAHQIMDQLGVRRLIVSSAQNELRGILTQSSILAALDPFEMQNTITVLQTQVKQLQSEREQLLKGYTAELESKVELSERKFQAIFDQTFQFMGLLEPDGTLIEANQAALNFVERTRAEVINRPFWETPWWQISAEVQQQLKDSIALAMNGQFVRYEVDILGAHQVATVDFSLRPIKNENGQVILIIPEGRDITDLKRAEAAKHLSEQNFANLAKAAPVGIFHTDAMGNCLYVNEQWRQISGLTLDEAKGEGWLESIYPEDRNLVGQAWYRAAQNDQPFQLEYRFCSKEGKVTWVFGRAVAQKDDDNRVCGYVGTIMDITERKQAELALKQLNQELELRVDERTKALQLSEARYRILYKKTPMMLHSVDQEGRLLYVSDHWLQHLGYSHDEVIGRKLTEFLTPESRKIEEKFVFPEFIKTGSCSEVAYQVVSKAGSVVDVLLSAVSQKDAADQPISLAVMVDITDRKKLEQALFREKELAQVTLHSIGDAVITTNALGLVEYFNPVAEQLTGWDAGSALGKPLPEVFHIIHETTREPVDNPIERALRDGVVTGLADHTVLIAKDGTEYAIEDSAAPIRDRSQRMIGAVLVFHDVTQSRQLSRQLSWQASHDELTTLANRRHFEYELNTALQELSREHQGHVLCFLDLDQFKVVNDTCGHLAGDELLQKVASLLKEHIRAMDILARLGGDEFGILLKQCPLSRAQVIAENLRQAIHQFRFHWQDKTFSIGVSIGLMSLESESHTLSDVMSAADAACYAAKEAGRNRIHIYRDHDLDLVKQRGERRWSLRIRQALEQDRFCLFSQAIAKTKTGVGAESHHHEILLRMIDEQGNLIPPGDFIPAAERYHLMNEIDRWVVTTFFAHLETVHEQMHAKGATPETLYFINLSGKSLNSEFLRFLKEKFFEYSVPPRSIGFEITETAAISHFSQASHFINELKGMGCSFALDDFGSGLSSFGYLKTLPVDYLKIDGKFICDIVEDRASSAIVESINHIGHVLELKTIAEFVENETLRDHIEQIGIDFVQGYGISRPLPLLLAG